MGLRKTAFALVGAGLLGAQGASAAVVGSGGPLAISEMTTYSGFGGGDVLFKVSTPIGSCGGVWLKPADPGFQQNYAALLSARMSGVPVTLYVEDSDVWTGSSFHYCHLYGATI